MIFFIRINSSIKKINYSMKWSARFHNSGGILDFPFLSFFKFSPSENFIRIEVNCCSRFFTPTPSTNWWFSERNGVRFWFLFSLKIELQRVSYMQFSAKKIVFRKRTQNQTNQYCNLEEVAKTKLQGYQIKSTVFMPYLFCAINYRLQDWELGLLQ